MSDAKTTAEVEALRQAFADAGLDPAGIDLAWLARFKINTEASIAAARSDPAFAAAKPAFVRPGFMVRQSRGGDDGAA
jgi:hypothetical protein